MNSAEALLALRDLYDRGVRLRSEDIGKENGSLFHSIYRTNSGVARTFENLEAARCALAEEFQLEGRLEDARKVLDYNVVRPSNKFSDEQIYQRRQELYCTLVQKINSGADVSMRFQQSEDRTFVSRSQRAFGSYRELFTSNGLVYEDYMRVRGRKSKNDYLQELIGHVRDKKRLDKRSLSRVDKDLVEKLNCHFDGYYSALLFAAQAFERSGEWDLVSYASRDWRSIGRKKKSKRCQSRKKYALGKIREVDVLQSYDVNGVQLSGKDIAEEIRVTHQSTTEFARVVGCTSANILRRVYQLSAHCVKIIEGERHSYLIHPEMMVHKNRIKD